MRRDDLAADSCAIAQSLAAIGDAWSLLVVRDIAGGVHRFDALRASLDLSRRTLSDRLTRLTEAGVVERRPYQERPPRHEYHLTERGAGLLPALVALQDWGGRHLLGDGTLSATSAPDSVEARRVHELAGRPVPDLLLGATTAARLDPVSREGWTVLACLPGAIADPASYPAGWGEIPGAAGCTLEATMYRERAGEFAAAGAVVRMVSTATPRQLAVFAGELRLGFPLLSDEHLRLVTALRLPTFHTAGRDHLKRLTLVVGPDRLVRTVQYPVTDPAGSVAETLAIVAALGAVASGG